MKPFDYISVLLSIVLSLALAHILASAAHIIQHGLRRGSALLTFWIAIIAYMVVGRRQEIGIRLSLGSTRAQVVALVLRDSVSLLALGLLVGVPATVLAMRTASTLLFGISPTDLVTLAAAAALLGAAAGLASCIPAWRAARVDPQVALRCE